MLGQRRWSFQVANYTCTDCGVMLDAVDEGQTELCPICDKPMTINTGNFYKNFGGAGVAMMTEPPAADQPGDKG